MFVHCFIICFICFSLIIRFIENWPRLRPSLRFAIEPPGQVKEFVILFEAVLGFPLFFPLRRPATAAYLSLIF